MHNNMFYTHPATEWNEALPLGNGSLGAMVFGGIRRERIALNHEALWSGRPGNHGKPGAADAFYRARKLTLAGEYAAANDYIDDNFISGGTARYLPFGELTIDFDHPYTSSPDEAEDYTRELVLDTAIHRVSFRAGGKLFTREAFASYPDGVIVFRFTAEGGGMSANACLISQLKHKIHTNGEILILDGVCPIGREEYPDDPALGGIQFRGGISVTSDGTVTLTNEGFSVVDSSEIILMISIKTGFAGWNRNPQTEGCEYKNALHAVLEDASIYDYKALLDRHLADYQPLYNAVSLFLGESGREDLPTDERLLKFDEDHADNSLITLLFDYARYLTIASSREGCLPPNLQGIWNDRLFPPWASGWTVNINLQMNYWPTLMCGLFTCHKPLLDFMKTMRESGRFSARNDYNAPGFMFHHATDIWGVTGSIRCPVRCAFFCGAAGWLCRNLYDYYEYTLDANYLRDECLPIMKEAAEFYLYLLCDRGDGKWSVVPQGSPENGFYAPEAPEHDPVGVAKYTAMTDSIVFDLFTNCRKAMRALNEIDEAFDAKLAEMLAKMEPWHIMPDGRINEWDNAFSESDPNHRHISPLYALHPANYIKAGTPEADACRTLLEKRGDASTGWSVAWKANCWARLHDGERALKLLQLQLRPVAADIREISQSGGTYPNLFCAHPPFQIDGNFGAASAILEMLIDPDGNPLPALPESWKSGYLKGVRIKGGHFADLVWENGRLVSFVKYN